MKRGSLATIWLVSLFTLLLAPWGTPTLAVPPVMLSDDAIARPPAHQAIPSASGNYILVLTAPADWSSKYLTASLYTTQGNLCQPLWSQTLPQEYGPRFAFVNDQGEVGLLDEWINVASDYAVVVLSPRGDTVAQYSFEDLAARLKATRADIVDAARYGWWISAMPTLSRTGQTLQVETAHKQLTVNLETGRLSL